MILVHQAEQPPPPAKGDLLAEHWHIEEKSVIRGDTSGRRVLNAETARRAEHVVMLHNAWLPAEK